MASLPKAPVDRLMREAGAERIHPEALEALRNLTEEYARDVTREALKLMSHAGRKTLTAHDLQMAADILK